MKNETKNKQIYGFKLGKRIIDIKAEDEQKAFKILGTKFWNFVIASEKIELLGELKND